MNKVSTSELAAEIANDTDESRAVVKRVLDAMTSAIIGHVTMGNAVTLNGLGKFYPSIREARVATSPVTGEKMEVPARTVLAFKRSSRVNNL